MLRNLNSSRNQEPSITNWHWSKASLLAQLHPVLIDGEEKPRWLFSNFHSRHAERVARFCLMKETTQHGRLREDTQDQAKTQERMEQEQLEGITAEADGS